MAYKNIKGIIVEIGGDTSGLEKALKKVYSATSSLSKELSGINSMLKLDPKSTELLNQKQNVLNQTIKETSEELTGLKEAQRQYIESGGELNTPEYRNLQREIINAKSKLEELKIEASQWTKTGRSIEEFGNKVSNISDRIDKLGTTITTRLTAPITALATAGVLYDAQIEKYETAFKTFLGSAEKASKAIKNIKDDAKKTPFDTTSLVKANQMLISTGVSADQAREDILALGEAVIATGGGNDELTRMASNLQQIKNAGKATAMDIRQFAYAGIDVYGILADYLGKTTDEIKDMEISYDDLTKALKKAGSEGGKYFGAMANSSETLTGQVSALKSEVQDGMGELTKSLMPIAKKVVAKIREVIKTFDGLTDAEKENIVKIGLLVAAIGPAIKILGTMGKTVGTITKGIGSFSQAIALVGNTSSTAFKEASSGTQMLAKGFTFLTSPAGIALAAVAAVAAVVTALSIKLHENAEKMKEYAKSVEENRQTFLDYQKTIEDNAKAELSHINQAERLKEELKELVDENGKVKEGYQDRVRFILNELNSALGTEYKLNEDIIESYQTLQDEIDKTIKKKKAEIIMESYSQKYKKAMEDEEKAVKSLAEARENANKMAEKWNVKDIKGLREKRKAMEEIRDMQVVKEFDPVVTQAWYDEIDAALDAYDNANQTVIDINNDKIAYEEKAIQYEKGLYEEMANSITASVEDYTDASLKTIKDSLEEHSKTYETYKAIYEETQDQVAKELMENAKANIEALRDELVERTSTLGELGEDEIEAWKTLADKSYDEYEKGLSKMSPEMQEKIRDVVETVSNDTTVSESTKNLGEEANDGFNGSVDGKKWGSDLVDNIVKGLTSLVSKNSISGAASKVGGWISSYLHHSTPEKGPLKNDDEWMPDLIDSMVYGINSNKFKVIKSARELAKDLNEVLTNNTNYPAINDFGKLQSNLSNKINDSTRTIFTTPQIVFNVQELDEARLQQCFNYVNRKFGSAY